jgi:hypothetical protein
MVCGLIGDGARGGAGGDCAARGDADGDCAGDRRVDCGGMG